MSGLTRVGSEMTVVAMSALNGKRLLAVSAVGDPASFACQLSLCGAVVASLAFPDHHDFSRADVDGIITRAGAVEMIVCTLKDAVKLECLWPVGAPSLWYVSQSLEVESGGAAIDELLNRFRPAN